MKTLNFRTLTAGEVDCRIATVKESGISLLLYKDARVDQNILDEMCIRDSLYACHISFLLILSTKNTPLPGRTRNDIILLIR